MPVATIKRGGQQKNNWDNYVERFQVAARMYGRSDDWISACLGYALALHKNSIPVIYDTGHLARLCGISSEHLLMMAWNTGAYYKHWKIPKRKAGQFRDISEPLPSLKQVQRFLHSEIYSNVPVSGYCYSYVCGRGVKQHAECHVGKQNLYAVDIKNFFPSISARRIYGLNRFFGFSVEISWILARLCTLDDGLPQGAPTSPVLSNLIARRLDRRLAALARKTNMSYSRYADDIVFSSDVYNPGILKTLGAIILAEGFELNENKTRVMKKSARQFVTGAVVNDRVRVSRESKKEMRMDVYFIKKYGVLSHMQRKGISKTNYLGHLIGKLEWASFLDSSDKELKLWVNELRGISNYSSAP